MGFYYNSIEINTIEWYGQTTIKILTIIILYIKFQQKPIVFLTNIYYFTKMACKVKICCDLGGLANG